MPPDMRGARSLRAGAGSGWPSPVDRIPVRSACPLTGMRGKVFGLGWAEAGPGELSPHQPAAIVAGEPRSYTQTLHQQQATATLPIWIIDHAGRGEDAAVGDRYLHHGPLPGDLHREPATSPPASGMPDRVGGQFVSHDEHVVARRAL